MHESTMNPIETEERARLDDCQTRIHSVLATIHARLDECAQEVKTRKEYMWDARRDMDHIEKIAVRQSIDQTLDAAEALRMQQNKLLKLMRSPYFGRFDFARSGDPRSDPIYIGVHHFRDDAQRQTLVYDWRAPISSMFYDFETGLARYQAPVGEIEGLITRKRQFRIREGQMEFVLETGVNIVDDVLQEELSRASNDEGMKNIVATIQRDQNAIIRNDDAHTLIIQGVAGSGKTSIALHRIAYLLYRFKDTLSSGDILIISPNRVFADYIGNVLPELGEEQVPEIGMEVLAAELLDHQYRFQSFFEQTAQLLEKNDEAFKARIAAKAAPEFLRQIDRYTEELEQRSFESVEWRTGRRIVPEWFFSEVWHKHRGVELTERVARVVAAAEQQIGIYYNHDLEVEERRALREAIRAMVRKTTLRQAYQGLFEWMEQPELFKPAGGKLEYADVFPLIYLKMRLEGITNPYQGVKHLLIDEMQDYTPVQYAVLGRIFTCRKTVLGDATQSVNPYTSSTAEQICQSLHSATSVKLTKSYRSTWEIMQFALAISPNPELEAMKRHGEAPQVHVCKRPAQMTTGIADAIVAFKTSDHQSLAIIAKTQKQAAKLHKALVEVGCEARLLDGESAGFSTGAIVCTAHLAKGLEFDRVIVADVSASNYATEMDRNLLYVACTRAMHRLSLFAVGSASAWLPIDDGVHPNRPQ
ncbi:MAG: ATP-binding domain-containing protein [Gammaproteobacteria bacterium]|uniref:HelD family protein n=1 Tax=Rhodoferax sp. TaxID=50421 RepID=UPI0017E7C849|nr:3'-5' exonuclease [Rhodoferax sp.]MBU3900322.1 ATP-binding domain-containing protein [Gammaproteobacteria bacterium]MBA3058490.1 AAA family ATPase [Rhodoferax sp.]MBU3998038.1 ATP-binding domain-containing protein [Gammaproteobacteria bacterium]MBU4018909.1 ATP-binding domain-containing protein [Gammaproteobacteria bacterium]MBU4080899.1 ATP-binding domain-containing protein [Gammaproteobacteria bacterium]